MDPTTPLPTRPGFQRPPPESGSLVSAYANMLGLPPSPPGEGLALRVDERYRLHLRDHGGGVLLASRLGALPPNGAARDLLLRHAGRHACAAIIRSPAACVVDAREHGLWLQWLAKPGTPRELDERVGGFINELAYWREILAAC